jgi:sialic acid synthase SpsE/mannose-6-phosphate isomerase-like protein (cupin superfamily)
MANNHSGEVNNGKRIIAAVKEVCVFEEFDYAFKLQYRHLDSFIHKTHQSGSCDKNAKRFLDTKLSPEQFFELKEEIKRQGFISICTPFDEISVELVVDHDYDYIKIASCSFTDWPLWEKVVQYDKPIIASTAGAAFEEIDRIAAFLTNRNKRFSLMHCVGEYPTAMDNLQLNQIDLLRQRYQDIRVGYSTHEETDNYTGIAIAVAKGASIFERHVGIASDKVVLNAYSSTPEQIKPWLAAARGAFIMCGAMGKRHEISEGEKSELWNLRRGVFARRNIEKGALITRDNVYLAIPKTPGQVTANNLSKYVTLEALTEISPDSPVCFKDVEVSDERIIVCRAHEKVKELLMASLIVISPESSFELSHHYGIERFFENGAAIIECINRSYCKKIIALLPGQKHPAHFHKKKSESFQVLYGEVDFTIDGISNTYSPGEIVHVLPGQRHSFSSENGAVFEEVSTTHYVNDSFYDDDSINKNRSRKTKIEFWKAW